MLNSKLKPRIKNSALGVLRTLTRRHPVLLPSDACSEAAILHARAPYRVELPGLVIELQQEERGWLTAELLTYVGSFPTTIAWKGSPRAYMGPCQFSFDLVNGAVCLNGEAWGRVNPPLSGRRFCWRFVLDDGNRHIRRRLTGHYIAVAERMVDGDYFNGDDYLDHEAQSAQEHRDILDLLQRHNALGPVLEIGCATGGLLAVLDKIGVHSLGLDSSEWAVTKAVERLGPRRAWVCNVEHDQFPDEVLRHAPFGTVILWAVLEHFTDPFRVLERLTSLCSKGSTLLINTTNADSLTHIMFGEQWEGHFDWTHRGVELVTAQCVRQWLNALQWRIHWLTTGHIWDRDADPSRATLRDWWDADSRFRELLTERELGDLLRCVAVKE